MTKHLTILLLFVSLLSYSNVTPVTPASDWRTEIQNASAGDTIYFTAGTYTWTTGIDVPTEVSLLGVDTSSTIIYVPVTGDYSWGFWFSSGATGTMGRQSISHIKFYGLGDQSGTNFSGCIKVEVRDSVFIHDCLFMHFDDNAVTLAGQPYDGNSEPTEWMRWCEVYNNRFIDCCKEQLPGEWMSGALQLGTQDSILIHDNYFEEYQRGAGNIGYPIKYFAEGYNRGMKIYNNTINRLPGNSSNWDEWNFAIEMWRWRGGCEIYDNVIQGSIDIDRAIKGDYDYSLKIYDNQFGYDSLPTSSGEWNNFNAAIYLEYSCDGIEFYNNYCKNLETIIRFSPRQDSYYPDLYVHHNVIHSIGNDNESQDVGTTILNFASEGTEFIVRNFKFENNTIQTDVGNASWGMQFTNSVGVFRNVSIQNNIFDGFDSSPIEITDGDFDTLNISNNNFYNNGTNAPNVTVSPSNYTYADNITTNPSFVTITSDLSLQETSLAIDAGLDLGYTTDYLGNNIYDGLAPDIGAYEYQSEEEPEIPEATIPTIKSKCFISGGNPRVRNGKILMQ